MAVERPRRIGWMLWWGWLAAAATPLVLLLLLRGVPVDPAWENHPAHFWLVFGAAAIATALGCAVSSWARRRLDARLFFIALAFVASAGFLGMHALATPGVLVGPTPGFELATPVGLLAGGLLVVVSSLELGPDASRRVIRSSGLLLGGLFAVVLLWGVVSLVQVPPLDDPLQEEELNGWQDLLGGAGVLSYAAGALGYLRLYRRRPVRFVVAVIFAFALLAEAMVVIAFAENWHASWWEWHVLMLAAFALIAVTARIEWHEERFSALYLDQTLSGTREASILFADLQGYTSFSENTSPARVVDMLNSYFGRLILLMRELGGDVHQIIGDALMVVFNKEGDEPDHARMAAEAALAFQREAAAVARDHPGWPRFRVGVNSGEVSAGVIGAERGHRQHGLVGDTVNLAARLESSAPVGEVVIGSGTYSRLPDGCVVERLPLMHVKGKEEEIVAYVLRGMPPSA